MKLDRNNRELAQQAYEALRAHAAGEALTEGQMIVLTHLCLAERNPGGPLSITPLGGQLLNTGPDFFPYE